MIRLIRNWISVIKFYERGFANDNNDRNSYSFERAVFKGKPRLMRDLLAVGLRKHTKYVVDTKALEQKRLYEKYYEENPTVFRSVDEVKAGDWVTVISRDYPVRGKRYYEYYMNTGFGYDFSTYKVKGVSEYGDNDEIEVFAASGNESTHSIEISRLRPATEDEKQHFYNSLLIKKDEGIEGLSENCENRVAEQEEKYRKLISILRD